jgi:hypothetical protein
VTAIKWIKNMIPLKDIQKSIKDKRFLLGLQIVTGIIVILVIGHTIIEALKPLEVITVTPPNTTTTTIIADKVIEVTFNKSVSNSEKQKITIVSEPKISGEILWENNKTATIVTNAGKTLEVLKKYTISVKKDEQILTSWTFFTSPYEGLSEEQQFAQFAEGQVNIVQNYEKEKQVRPWIEKLPITKKEYIVYWSEGDTSLYAQLYLRTGNLTTPQKIDEIKRQIQSELITIGVDINKEKIIYQELKV